MFVLGDCTHKKSSEIAYFRGRKTLREAIEKTNFM